MLPIAYVFKKGHRIRLELANGDLPATYGVFSHPYHPSLMGYETIKNDAAHASMLILPVIAAALHPRRRFRRGAIGSAAKKAARSDCSLNRVIAKACLFSSRRREDAAADD